MGKEFYKLSQKEQDVFRRSLRKSVKIIHKAEPMTDTNKAQVLEALKDMPTPLPDDNDGIMAIIHWYGEYYETIRALSPNAVVIEREDFERVKYAMQYAHENLCEIDGEDEITEKALAILEQYGERK